jgi:hypothetical protein
MVIFVHNRFAGECIAVDAMIWLVTAMIKNHYTLILS